MKRIDAVLAITMALSITVSSVGCAAGTTAAIQTDISAQSSQEDSVSNSSSLTEDSQETASSEPVQSSGSHSSAAPKPVLKDLKNAQVKLPKDVFEYTGTPVVFSEDEAKQVKVYVDGNQLQMDRDYTLSYSKNTRAGHRSAKLIVTGKGKYTGKKEADFTILPRQVQGISASVSKGYVDVSWDALGEAEGYLLLYCTNDGFSDNMHEVFVDSGSSYTIKEGFTGGDQVFVKVCAYYTEDINHLCGPYSETKSVKVTGELDAVILTAKSFRYTGEPIAPEVKVYSTQHEELIVDKDYTLEITEKTEPGRSWVKVKGKGNYKGELSESFDICLPKNEITSIRSESGVVEITWKEDPKAQGYYLLCSRNADFYTCYYMDYKPGTTTGLVETYSLGEGYWYFKVCSYTLPDGPDGEKCGVYSDAVSVLVEAPPLPEESSEPEVSEEPKTSDSSTASDTESSEESSDPTALKPLENKLRNTVSGYNGIWSVYVKNLRTGDSFSINNRKLYTASLMKLFGMTAAYQAIEDGRISESSLSSLLKDMITISDNDAFNQIVRKIGKYSVRDWIEANGYKETRQVAGFVSGNNYWETVISSGYNYSSVNDCGKLLESIYRKECVSEEASEKMLELLKRQKLTSKIPSVIPSSVVTANKTGEYMGTNHDVAIIFLEDNPYILCVFSETDGYLMQYSYRIRDISKIVFEFMSDL